MTTISIPLFPLNGVILFPSSSLPLNIFEERYLEMIDFSLSSNRMIGMIQKDNKKKLYKIGCIGKIGSFYETNDGRYIINLIGKNYFKIIKEISSLKKFIIADAKIQTNKNQVTNNSEYSFSRSLLLDRYKTYIEDQNIKVDFNLIKEIENEKLIKFIAMSCQFSTEDKQMLLETYNLSELANKIMTLFDFYQHTKNNSNLFN